MFARTACMACLIVLVGWVVSAEAEVDFDVIRPSWDLVVTEVCGANYISIDDEYLDFIVNARTKLSRFDGPLDPEVYTEFLRRIQTIEIVEEKFHQELPSLESIYGLKIWATWTQPKEEPPALYIGLYEPTEAHIQAIADATREYSRQHGIVIRFYEALAPQGTEFKQLEAKDIIAYEMMERNVDPDMPVQSVGAVSITGALIVNIDYMETGRTYPEPEYIRKVVARARAIAGCEVPIEFAFGEFEVVPDTMMLDQLGTTDQPDATEATDQREAADESNSPELWALAITMTLALAAIAAFGLRSLRRAG